MSRTPRMEALKNAAAAALDLSCGEIYPRTRRQLWRHLCRCLAVAVLPRRLTLGMYAGVSL